MGNGISMDEFEEKLGAHRNEFFRFILRNVWDSGVAEDVFSQAVLAAYENRSKYTPGTNFRAWMFRILTNKCFVTNRETGRTFERLDESTSDLLAVGEAQGYGDLLADPRDFLEQCGDEVYRAFRRLSTAERSCILLRDVERFSYQEIADIMEIPNGTVMTHLARGRKKLREELLDYAKDAGIVRTFPHLKKPQPKGEGNQGSAISL
jgi:RNA polymerase sigma-70 factor (ECF subfamily)